MVLVIIRLPTRFLKYGYRKELKKGYSETSRSLLISKCSDRLPTCSASYEIN
ncbi:MAG: hypothetical protein P8I45_06455 [Nitrospinaceae bacterium]|nr:hypothetical protein [Nitrospinaceae bacterium]